MKYERTKTMHVIHEQNAVDYMNAVNELFRMHPNASIDRDTTTPFLSYHIINEEIAIPETIAERYETAGIPERCGDCPVFNQNKLKGNQKIYPCQFAKYGRTHIESNACDRFYKFHGRFGEMDDFEIWHELTGRMLPGWVKEEFERAKG